MLTEHYNNANKLSFYLVVTITISVVTTSFGIRFPGFQVFGCALDGKYKVFGHRDCQPCQQSVPELYACLPDQRKFVQYNISIASGTLLMP
jgi:hypothetical protein